MVPFSAMFRPIAIPMISETIITAIIVTRKPTITNAARFREITTASS